jgi:fatty acid desaturase
MMDDSGKPPFSAIFDFSFKEFISIDLIRVLYVFAFLVAALAMVSTILAGFSASFWWGLGSIIVAPVVFFLIVFIARIGLETMVVLFRIAENTRETADNTKGE